MLVKTSIFISTLAGLVLATWTPFTFAPQLPSPSQESKVSEVEIERLISQFGDENFKIREGTTKRLTEIGLPALDALEKAEANSADRETQQRAAALAKYVRRANRLPTKVAGIEFKLITQREWPIPPSKSKTSVQVELQITNNSGSVCRFHEEVAVHLADSNGKPLKIQVTQIKDVPPLAFHKVEKNQTLKIPLNISLLRVGQDADVFYQHPTGNIPWAMRGLSKGSYRLSVVYANSHPQLDGSGVPAWIGTAETLDEVI